MKLSSELRHRVDYYVGTNFSERPHTLLKNQLLPINRLRHLCKVEVMEQTKRCRPIATVLRGATLHHNLRELRSPIY